MILWGLMNESLIHSLNQFVKNNDSFRNKTFHSLHDLLRFVKKKKKMFECKQVFKSDLWNHSLNWSFQS